MRGEHTLSKFCRDGCAGSSPHARGTLDQFQCQRSAIRFIPACAGNTRSQSGGAGSVPVHPRMRGEHRYTSSSISDDIGSSPHARGTRHRLWPTQRGSRFIPACAGNTRNGVPTDLVPQVHPRMRGEHMGSRRQPLIWIGSSPHARGTRLQDSGRKWCGRFIPACAGNTSSVSAQSSPRAVHPRMRGEHAVSQERFDDVNGSSPHARGTRCAIPR